MDLILKNVRCFFGKHTIPIKPLTILVGENNSGKSTILAALATVCDPFGFPMRPNFNDPPYSWGPFDSIVATAPRTAKRMNRFSLGYEHLASKDKKPTQVLAEFGRDRGRTRVLGFSIVGPRGKVSLRWNRTRKSYDATMSLPHKGTTRTIRHPLSPRVVEQVVDLQFGHPPVPYLFGIAAGSQSDAGFGKRGFNAFLAMREDISQSIGPIRMRPSRVYTHANESADTEGNHIPTVLARVLSEKDASKGGMNLIRALKGVGFDSGLFDRLVIKRLGKNLGDPFQVLLKVAGGPPSNLIDVGYGVSQALPIVVQTALLAPHTRLLLQQPEVHLHPRAQAALASFFVNMVARGGKHIVVETHSDYIIDRIRQEVAAGKIASEDVLFLYLERKGVETKVFPLTLDKLGNIEGAPPSYREFFLRETMNLLSRGE